MAAQALAGEGVYNYESAECKKEKEKKNHESVLTRDGVYVFHFVYEDKRV